MGLYLIIDALILLIVLLKMFRGAVRGFFLSLSGVIAMIGGLLGGIWVSGRFSEQLLQSVLLPWVDKAMGTSISIDLPDSISNLAEALENTDLPAFLTSGIAEEAMARAKEAGSNLLVAAKELIALRGAEIIVFILGFIVIYALILLLFRGLNLLFRLPVLGTFNKILGAMLGVVSGVLLSAVLLGAAYFFFPTLSVSGGVFSPEVMEKTYLTKYFFDYILVWL
jgi:uncharacterized membrane protein required for colicin V production